MPDLFPLLCMGLALRFLILLSAMIAGLTGLIAGSPASARAGEPTMIAASLVSGTEQARTSVAVRQFATRHTSLRSDEARPLARSLPLAPQSHPVNERRNE
ncbi:hypothetical protein HJG53_00090 [Sphingomonas sp. ID1715]|uniref:hypothetical protein n=1 Tax=Sphingomonas sp. ID1715 TaxID=1656898 RepID=UPI001488ED5F|nr:hypothetical protein [Sphingomonas sp. ID1715]NNM75311.1 hypothetical protein [Sphingomonas sp. ID1715]